VEAQVDEGVSREGRSSNSNKMEVEEVEHIKMQQEEVELQAHLLVAYQIRIDRLVEEEE
jgi:hypothetical protein